MSSPSVMCWSKLCSILGMMFSHANVHQLVSILAALLVPDADEITYLAYCLTKSAPGPEGDDLAAALHSNGGKQPSPTSNEM